MNLFLTLVLLVVANEPTLSQPIPDPAAMRTLAAKSIIRLREETRKQFYVKCIEGILSAADKGKLFVEITTEDYGAEVVEDVSGLLQTAGYRCSIGNKLIISWKGTK